MDLNASDLNASRRKAPTDSLIPRPHPLIRCSRLLHWPKAAEQQKKADGPTNCNPKHTQTQRDNVFVWTLNIRCWCNGFTLTFVSRIRRRRCSFSWLFLAAMMCRRKKNPIHWSVTQPWKEKLTLFKCKSYRKIAKHTTHFWSWFQRCSVFDFNEGLDSRKKLSSDFQDSTSCSSLWTARASLASLSGPFRDVTSVGATRLAIFMLHLFARLLHSCMKSPWSTINQPTVSAFSDLLRMKTDLQ